jgi:hypothetical protein
VRLSWPQAKCGIGNGNRAVRLELRGVDVRRDFEMSGKIGSGL